MGVSGLWCHSVRLAALKGVSVSRRCFMPLGAILSRRLCGVWTIGNPASRASHSKPLGMSEGSRIPWGSKSVLESILRLRVAGLRVSAHSGRTGTRVEGGADIPLTGQTLTGWGDCIQMGTCHFHIQTPRPFSDGQVHILTPKFFEMTRSVDAVRFSDAIRSATVTESTLECC